MLFEDIVHKHTHTRSHAHTHAHTCTRTRTLAYRQTDTKHIHHWIDGINKKYHQSDICWCFVLFKCRRAINSPLDSWIYDTTGCNKNRVNSSSYSWLVDTKYVSYPWNLINLTNWWPNRDIKKPNIAFITRVSVSHCLSIQHISGFLVLAKDMW